MDVFNFLKVYLVASQLIKDYTKVGELFRLNFNLILLPN
jgi:hypothetical protein